MKRKSRSEETVEINLWSGGKFWTTIKVPKAWAERLTDQAEKAGITFDEVFERALREYIHNETLRHALRGLTS